MFGSAGNQGDHHTISGCGILFIKRYADTQCRRVITVENAQLRDVLIPATMGIALHLHERIVECEGMWLVVCFKHNVRKHGLSLMDSGGVTIISSNHSSAL